jgi:tripartite-type tricarboxylate transporter receptor subunit TctC
VAVVVVVALVLAGCAQKQAQSGTSEADFFKGKTISIIVPHGAGGGYDTYARLIAPYLQKYLPGSTVVVENVTGAGGLIGRNKIYTSKPDGLTLGFTTITGALFAEWAEKEGVQYKVAEFSWLGRILTEPHVMVVSAKSKLRSLDDVIKAGKITMGFSGVGSDDYFVALIAAKLLGYQLDPITGFSGSREADLACVKGEVDSVQTTYSSIRPLIESKDVVPILVFAKSRLPELPDVPTVLEKTSGNAASTMEAIIGAFELDRVMFAPPGVPAERLRVLREALDKAVEDPDFRQACEKAQRPVLYLPGSEVEKLIDTIKLAEPQLKSLVREIAKGAG